MASGKEFVVLGYGGYKITTTGDGKYFVRVSPMGAVTHSGHLESIRACKGHIDLMNEQQVCGDYDD